MFLDIVKRIFYEKIFTFTIIVFLSFLSLNTNSKDFKDEFIYELSDVESNYSYESNIGLVSSGVIYVTIELKDTLVFNDFDEYGTQRLYSDLSIAELKMSYSKYNNEFINPYNISYYSRISISHYALFIQIEYFSYDEFLKDRNTYIKMFQNEYVKNIYISDEYTYEYTSRNTLIYLNSSLADYSIDDAFDDINIPTNNTYDGDGINIGILETGILDSYTNFQNVNVYTYGSTLSSHATLVMSILGGDYGVAPSADLYIASTDDYSKYDCINWLINNDVDVINMSMGTFNSTYTSTSSFIDYVVRNTKVSFIAAAGNRLPYLNSPFEISSPSTGLNVFSIGSYDVNQNISFFSGAWDDPYDGEIIKPTLVAPGGGLVNITNITGKHNGTSSSTPMVTGIVALLMEQYPDLKEHPEKVMAMLCASTYKLPTQTSVWDEDAGYGSVDYTEAVNTYENTGFYEIPTNISSNALVKSISITVPANTTIKICNFVLYNSLDSTIDNDENTEKTYDFSDYIVKVYEGASLVTTLDSDSNIICDEYSNQSTSSKNIKIKIYLEGSKVGSNTEYASISVSGIEHTHDITHTAVNSQYHLDECWCGYSELEEHQFVAANFSYLGFNYEVTPNYIPMYVCRFCGYETIIPPL